MWSSALLVEDSISIDRDYLSLPLRHLETIKSDDVQRPMWSSALLVEGSMSIDRDYFSLPLRQPKANEPIVT